VFGCNRALCCFLNLREKAIEPEGWKNPIWKVEALLVEMELLDPVPLQSIKARPGDCE